MLTFLIIILLLIISRDLKIYLKKINESGEK